MAPNAKGMFVVRMIEPEGALVLGDATGGMSWALVLEPVDKNSTRHITRSRGAYDRLPSDCSSSSSGTRSTSGCNDGS
ncbi:MAG: hypothetical protein JOZ98_05140 [Solirubrobacterales bacterium]|nr:hypothetical protein [Solirubrobacterales bacterium]MBV9799965.1 hypothetical protein [Solirubrobacterales bacterium]